MDGWGPRSYVRYPRRLSFTMSTTKLNQSHLDVFPFRYISPWATSGEISQHRKYFNPLQPLEQPPDREGTYLGSSRIVVWRAQQTSGSSDLLLCFNLLLLSGLDDGRIPVCTHTYCTCARLTSAADGPTGEGNEGASILPRTRTLMSVGMPYPVVPSKFVVRITWDLLHAHVC